MASRRRNSLGRVGGGRGCCPLVATGVADRPGFGYIRDGEGPWGAMPRGRAPSREGGEGNVGSGVTGVKEGGNGVGATGAGASDDT